MIAVTTFRESVGQMGLVCSPTASPPRQEPCAGGSPTPLASDSNDSVNWLGIATQRPGRDIVQGFEYTWIVLAAELASASVNARAEISGAHLQCELNRVVGSLLPVLPDSSPPSRAHYQSNGLASTSIPSSSHVRPLSGETAEMSKHQDGAAANHEKLSRCARWNLTSA